MITDGYVRCVSRIGLSFGPAVDQISPKSCRITCNAAEVMLSVGFTSFVYDEAIICNLQHMLFLRRQYSKCQDV